MPRGLDRASDYGLGRKSDQSSQQQARSSLSPLSFQFVLACNATLGEETVAGLRKKRFSILCFLFSSSSLLCFFLEFVLLRIFVSTWRTRGRCPTCRAGETHWNPQAESSCRRPGAGPSPCTGPRGQAQEALAGGAGCPSVPSLILPCQCPNSSLDTR